MDNWDQEAIDLVQPEVDDSSGYFGTFGGSLFSRWVTARQAASADPADTVARLLTWMANTSTGHR